MPWGRLVFKKGRGSSEQLTIITGSMRAKKVVSRKLKEETFKE